MIIHCLQHVPFETPAAIEDWAAEKSHKVTKTLLFDDETLPAQDTFDALVVMGGPMGVYDEDQYSWLAPEKEFIKSAIDNNKPVLGVCLGAQLLAEVLGAKVYPGHEKEIGWFPVSLTEEGASFAPLTGLPKTFTPLHWHGDTFDLPEGATRLASNDVYPNQAFQYGENVLGLQFHLELRPNDVEELIENCRHEFVDAPFIQQPEEILEEREAFSVANELLSSVLDKLAT